MRDAVLNGYSSSHTLDQNRNLRVLFGITALDFHQSAASLSFRFINISTRRKNPNPPKFLDFDLEILNETVIFRMRVDVAIIQQGDIDEIYIRRGTHTCQVINQGIGYRSENYTFPVSVKPTFDPEVRQVYAALYYRGINLFNPNGSYFYLNWEFYYNHTDYTIVFHTQDENLVSFIDFSLILLDLNNAYEKIGYRRTFAIDILNCSNSLLQSCPGKSRWTADPNYQANFKSYLFGLTKLNFTKHTRTNWYFDTTDITNLVQNYAETNSLIWANMTVFIIAKVDCQPSSNAFDPQTKTCVSNCATSGSQYSLTQNGANGEKICRKCYYACVPGQCNNEQANQCNACNGSKFRQPDSGGGTYRCRCMTGYIDVGLELCRPCSYYIPGCQTCSSTTTCTLCGTNMRLTSNNSCQCSLVQTTSRYGTCQGIVGCLVYFNDPVRSTVCIECNITQNFMLFNYTCDCIPGYQLVSIGGKWICALITQVCGDGIRTLNQQCDDFNTFNWDGCNSSCQIEIGFQCYGNLRQMSFCIENISTLEYVGAMKIQGQQTTDVYFELWPYNQKLQDVGFLSKYLHTSISSISSMKNLQIFTQPYHADNKLRIRLRYDYTQNVDTSIEHYLALEVSDRQKQYQLQTKFYITGNNLKLAMVESQNNLAPLNYVMLVLVILVFLALFISIFKQNWIGIELIHTFQFCFFYYLLLQNIDEKQFNYLNFLQFCNGFNRLSDFFSYYEYSYFNRKIYLMNFRQQILMNFNFTALVFSLPLLLVGWKMLRKITICNRKSRILKETRQSIHQKQNKSCLDYILSSQFIIGRVFITLNLAFMNVILFSLFIEQTSFLQENQYFNRIFQQFYLFALVTSVLVTIGLLVLAAVSPFRYDDSRNYSNQKPMQYVKFKRFSPTYPIIYTSIVGMKIIFVALFVSSSYSPYILLAVEFLYFIGFLLIRPYKQIRPEQDNYCYLLHNLHNFWNSFGLIVLISVIIIANNTNLSSSNSLNAAIKFIIFSVQLISLILAYMRLFMSKRLAIESKNLMRQKTVDKTFDKSFDPQNVFQETDRKLRNNQRNMRKDSIGKSTISKISKFNDDLSNIYTRKPTKMSSKSSPLRTRQFT